MSRCIPFPPPGYLWNGVGGEDLTKLIIKLKKECRRAKKERKKERRRQKKEMKKAKGNGESKQIRQSSYKRVDSDESITDCGKNDNQPTRLYQAEMLRNCSLMEDPRQPMISDNAYEYSSGNFHNIKRKRPIISPPNGCESREEYFPHSNRLRCLLHKHKDSLVVLSKPLFLTPTRMDFAVQEKVGMVLRPTEGQLLSGYIMPRTSVREVESYNELSLSNSGSTEFIAHENAENASTSSLYASGSPQIESQLRELIFDWIPSPVRSVRTEFDDQDWLFDTRLPGRQTDNNSNGCIAVSCPKNSTQLPHVHSTCAFPYTLPF